MSVKNIIGPTILLSNGEYFDFMDPASSIWGLDEIADGLAKTCRFAGQCVGFYSVAEHSLLVAELVEPKHRLAALLHDAAEAFTGDITKPLKGMIPEFKAIEKRIEQAIFDRFGVPLPMPVEVKDADMMMLGVEQHHLMRNNDQWRGVKEAPAHKFWRVQPKRLTWEKARAAWLDAAAREVERQRLISLGYDVGAA